jgi:4-amino-4-deoxy-L-arabinose transferase-like glycosyltransferase
LPLGISSPRSLSFSFSTGTVNFAQSVGILLLSIFKLLATSFFVFYLLLFIDVFVSKLSLKEVVKNFSITCFVFLLIVVPTTYLTQLHSNGTFFSSFYQLLEHATKVYDQGGPWYFYLNKIRINYGEGIYVYLILSIVFLYYNRKEPKVVLLITWIAIPIAIFSMSETKMPGYILITAPAFFILYGFISSWILQNYRSKYAQWFIIITIFVIHNIS